MKKMICLTILSIFSVAFLATKAHAIFVSPTYVAFDKGKSTARLTLNNRSNQIKVITFEWERRAFDENGKTFFVEDGQVADNYSPADPYIEFSPRRVILKPMQRQTVRLIAKRPQDMASGEYRSHFLIKEEKIMNSPVKGEGEKKGVAGEIIVNVNKSIPVFLRQGDTSVDVSLDKADMVSRGGKDFLDVSISNNSSRSIYGYVHLLCDVGNEVLNFRVAPLRIFTEIDNITKSIPLSKVDTRQCNSIEGQVVGWNDFELSGRPLSQKTIKEL